jgi:hypothetical protein
MHRKKICFLCYEPITDTADGGAWIGYRSRLETLPDWGTNSREGNKEDNMREGSG